MKKSAISKRYAKALLLISEEENRTEQYKDELSCFTNILNKNDNLKKAIINPLYNEKDRKKILLTILNRLKLSKHVNAFILLLFDKERISYISNITNHYEKFADEVKGIVRAKLVSAAELSSEIIEKTRIALSKRMGKNIVLDVKYDEELIGGMVTTIGDLVIDGSVKTQLMNMRESLKKGEGI